MFSSHFAVDNGCITCYSLNCQNFITCITVVWFEQDEWCTSSVVKRQHCRRLRIESK